MAPQSVAVWLAHVTLQVGFAGCCSDVAVNTCCEPAVSDSPVGEITNVGGVIWMLAVALVLLSASEIAVIVTVGSEGTELGAV